jgi:hypothetical protein
MRHRVQYSKSKVQHSKSKKRKGILSAELIFTLPILGLVMFGLFEFSLLFLARGELADASRAAARKASLPGVSAEQVELEVRKILPARLQDSLQVRVDGGTRTGDLVTVSIAVPMRNAAPDFLWPIGYSLKNRNLYHTTRMIKE